MGNYWLKIKIWTKGIAFGSLAIYMLMFFFRNDRKVSVWYFPFKPEYEISLIWLTVIVLTVGVIGALLVRTTFTTLRQIRDLRSKSRLDRIEREHADMKAKAAMLQTRTSMSSTSQVINLNDQASSDQH